MPKAYDIDSCKAIVLPEIAQGNGKITLKHII